MGSVTTIPSSEGSLQKRDSLNPREVLEQIDATIELAKREELLKALGLTEEDLQEKLKELKYDHEEDVTTLAFQTRNKIRADFERIIVDKKGSHDTYAAFGNEVFPAVDADGAPFPVICPEYSEFLKDNYPEKYQAMTHIIGWFRDMTSADGNDSDEYQEKYGLGIPMREFARIAKLPETSREYQMILNKLREGILNTVDFMMPERAQTYQEKMDKLKRVCEQANVMYEEFINDTYGKGSESEFGLTSEVHSENDPAQLIMMAFNENESSRIRFEAMRKVLDAREIGSAQLRRNPGQANKRNIKMLEKAGVFCQNPETNEKWETFYLVSHHPSHLNRQCMEAYFSKERPDDLGSDWKIAPMKLRSSEVWIKDKEGKGEKTRIYYHWIDREKDLFRMIQKGKIKDSKNQDQFTEDHNGQRIILQNLDHWQPLFRHKKGCLRKEGCDVDEWDWEVSVDGRNFEKISMRPGQSSNLQIIKHMEAVTFPPVYDEDGNQIEQMERHNYENQYFDPKMFANYEYQIGVNHTQYMVNRVMESSYASLTTPRIVYGHDPIEWQLKRNLEIIRETWGEEDAIRFGYEFINEKMEEKLDNDEFNEEVIVWGKKLCERYGIPFSSEDKPPAA